MNNLRHKPRIIFTGGGSAGHVTPNLPLITQFTQAGWEPVYIGSQGGIEQKLISQLGIQYYAITTAKLRRYSSWQNVLTPFKVVRGVGQALKLCRKLAPTVVFSKGGFVAFPVVLAAWLKRIPVVAHESDLTPGLANRLSYPFSKRIYLTFSASTQYFSNKKKLMVTGTPIRPALYQGNAEKGRMYCGFSSARPILLVIGGSLGSGAINQSIRRILPELVQHFQVVHICGVKKLDVQYEGLNGYRQFEYLHEALPDVLASADLVVSRAGANTLYELLALRKPHLLIPLPKLASRGDQIVNAAHFATLGLSSVLPEEELNSMRLMRAIHDVYQKRTDYQQRLAAFSLPNSVQLIYEHTVQVAQS